MKIDHKFHIKGSLFPSLSVLLVLFALAITSCSRAKDRPILRLPDPEKDVFQKSDFLGHKDSRALWKAKVTAVNVSGQDSFVLNGLQSQLMIGYFEITRDKLKWLRAVVPQKSPATSTRSLPELINQWDVTHTEKRLSEEDGKVTNKEEENTDLPAAQKKYFKVNWSSAEISELATFPNLYWSISQGCWSKKSSYLVDQSQKVSKDDITFTIGVEYEQLSPCARLSMENDIRRDMRNQYVLTVHYKYSFAQMDENKQQAPSYRPLKISSESDSLLSKYGYFTMPVESYQSDGRLENKFYLRRMNGQKPHVYFFAEDFPEKYKKIFSRAFSVTNQLFRKYELNDYDPKSQSCNTGFCLHLEENDGTKKFGDVRHSFVRVIEDLDPNAPLGYGPSDVNPYTGEIENANIVIWTGYLRRISKVIKQDLQYALKDQQNSSVIAKIHQSLRTQSLDQWVSTAQRLQPGRIERRGFDYLLQRKTFAQPQYSKFTSSLATTNLESDKSLTQHLFKQNLFDTSELDTSSRWLNQFAKPDASEASEHLAHAKQMIDYSLHRYEQEMNSSDTCLLTGADIGLATISAEQVNKISEDELIERIIYYNVLHELGHNLGLRHNFYGSMDAKNFNEVDGAKDKQNTLTSSLMDYLSSEAIVMQPETVWGSYDSAALMYLYSDGQKDLSQERKTQYLYCTDQHVPLNALCNKGDFGTTPSQVAQNLVLRYDRGFFHRNLRDGRAYWDSRNYLSETLLLMHQMKKFLPMWQGPFNRGLMLSDLAKIQEFAQRDHPPEGVVSSIEDDLRQANKIAMSFYNAVIHQSAADRDYLSEFDPQSGELLRQGILWDKIFAMTYLMGDARIHYDPNRPLYSASYLSVMKQLGERDKMNEIILNAVKSERPAMEPWFVDYARILYVRNATNYLNINNGKLMQKVRVACYLPETFKKRFNLDPEKYQPHVSAAARPLELAILDPTTSNLNIQDEYFRDSRERLGVAKIGNRIYVASEFKNEYAFSIISRMILTQHKFDYSLGTEKQDIRDLYKLYYMALNQSDADQCE